MMETQTTEPSPAQISDLVNAFYAKVRSDAQLAPLFDSKVTDWPAHQLKMTGFWRSVLLGTKEYRGHLMAKHEAMADMQPEHFSRWLALFDAAMKETMTPEAMPYTQYIAQRFARALQLGLFGNREQQREPAPLFVNPAANQPEASSC
jgi:hemoglobin